MAFSGLMGMTQRRRKAALHGREVEVPFARLMPLDQAAFAMYAMLYDDLTIDEEQDLAIAFCLGFMPVIRQPPRSKTGMRLRPNWLPTFSHQPRSIDVTR